MAKDSQVRFIGIDRPGFGLSDFKPKRALVDWPNDITELANSLGIDQFSILGVSGGGPYAAACAHQMPDRLISVGIVCGMGPVDVPRIMDQMVSIYRQGLRLTRRFPKIVTALYPFSSFFFRNYPESNRKNLEDLPYLKKNRKPLIIFHLKQELTVTI